MEEKGSSIESENSYSEDQDYEYLIFRLNKIKMLITSLEENFLFK